MEISLTQVFTPNSSLFSWYRDKFLQLLFPDRVYKTHSPITFLKTYICRGLLVDENTIELVIPDVIAEYKNTVAEGITSHLVIYGSHRISVYNFLISSSDLPADIPVILSDIKISKAKLIAENIAGQLPLDVIESLPEYLDNIPAESGISDEILRRLYPNGKLICPYQIDSDKYPFTRKF